MKRRGAFTLVELLLVIAIIGALVALILPAVQRSREASRKLRCQNNLKQMGIAFHSYHDSHRQFPPVYVAVRNSVFPWHVGLPGDADDANVHTYTEFLLSHMEQAHLAQKIDFKQPFFAPIDLSGVGLQNYTFNNQALFSTPLSVFLCPSSPRREDVHEARWELPGLDITYRTGGNDYGPSSGVMKSSGGLLEYGPPQPGPWADGILSNNYPNSGLNNIVDGTTHTALMWEIAGRPDVWHAGQRVEGATTPGGGWADVENAENWFRGTSADGATIPGPCAINCSNEKTTGVYSFHSGGVNLLLCDGSVQFLSENINVGLFVNMVTPNGGTIDPPVF